MENASAAFLGAVHRCMRAIRTAIGATRINPALLTRAESLQYEAYLPVLDAEWSKGCRNGAELWRRLKARGFRGSMRVVSEWKTRRRRAEQANDQQLQRIPTARTIARQMTIARDHLSKADTVIIAPSRRACRRSSRPERSSTASRP